MNWNNKTSLFVRLTPNAKKESVNGLWNEKYWRISVGAPAVDGKANQALIVFLANELKIPKSQIAILSGQTSRLKTLSIPQNTPLPWKK